MGKDDNRRGGKDTSGEELTRGTLGAQQSILALVICFKATGVV
jgi:hypothetical protein